MARPTIAAIQERVAGYYGMPPKMMTSACRDRNFARPRQVAMCLARRLTEHSFPRIGDMFGGRHHSTVIYAVRAVETRAASDGRLRRDVEALILALEGGA